MLTKDDLEKETDSLREEELQHKLRGYKIYWCDKMKEIFPSCAEELVESSDYHKTAIIIILIIGFKASLMYPILS